MSCWRVLELFEQPDGEQIPQLLVKPDFRSDSYTVHLTCLSNIWSEELDLDDIVDRASEQHSPIEVGKRDTAQLAILLDNVKRSLEHSDDAICRITRSDADGIILHTTITLPKPLDSLTWKFCLQKQTSTTLKNELILPLLISSHIQHERITNLVSIIKDKDRAITRLVDQYESSNMDLAAAFPIISGLKSGRKGIKREQAARHIPALQPFQENAFRQETGQLVDVNVSTLELFHEALSECTPKVPLQLKYDDGDVEWWTGVPNRLSQLKTPIRSKARKSAAASKTPSPVTDVSGDETEDEFENHSNFKTRNLPSKVLKQLDSSPPVEADSAASDDDATEDDDDLDAPPKVQSQRLLQSVRKPPLRKKSSTPEEPPSPQLDTASAAKTTVRSFRIGGKAKAMISKSPPLTHEDSDEPVTEDFPIKEPPSSQTIADAEATPKKARRAFKIGGRGKGGTGGSSQILDTGPPMADRTRATLSPSVQPPSSPAVSIPVKEETPAAEETPEKRVERRRAELKRKTEEAAKKQAQSKKKRRF